MGLQRQRVARAPICAAKKCHETEYNENTQNVITGKLLSKLVPLQCHRLCTNSYQLVSVFQVLFDLSARHGSYVA